MVAGITHFTNEKDYVNIYPSIGTWGIWYLPGNAKFHVLWTGIVEFICGLGLFVGGAIDSFAPVYYNSPNVLSNAGLLSDSATLLFFLTIAVTPANIYMYTHGAKLPANDEAAAVPMQFHYIRFVFQIILLSLLYQMGQGTFDEWIEFVKQ